MLVKGGTSGGIKVVSIGPGKGLLRNKPLFGPILAYCQLHPCKQFSVKFE